MVSDIFREVDEEVRRERIKQLWDRYGAIAIALAVVFLLAIGGWRAYQWWEAKKAAQAGAQFETALKLAGEGKHAEAQEAFERLAKEGTAGYRTLARFRAAEELSTRDPQSAVGAYDGLSANSSIGQTLQDLAAIRAGLILVDTAPYSDLKSRLEPLTSPERPFHHLARELLALSAWRSADNSAVKHWVDMIITDFRNPCGYPQPGRDAVDHCWPNGQRLAMKRLGQAVLAGFALASSLGVAGCGNTASDLVDQFSDVIPNTKKPLPGDRKAVFPEGVPGVPQGVPSELLKGSQPAAEVAGSAAPDAVPAKPSEGEKPKPKKVSRSKPALQSSQNPTATAGSRQQPAAAWPAPQAQAPAPWPAPASPAAASQAPAPWPAPAQQAPAPWPAPAPQQTLPPWPSSSPPANAGAPTPTNSPR